MAAEQGSSAAIKGEAFGGPIVKVEGPGHGQRDRAKGKSQAHAGGHLEVEGPGHGQRDRAKGKAYQTTPHLEVPAVPEGTPKTSQGDAPRRGSPRPEAPFAQAGGHQAVPCGKGPRPRRDGEAARARVEGEPVALQAFGETLPPACFGDLLKGLQQVVEQLGEWAAKEGLVVSVPSAGVSSKLAQVHTPPAPPPGTPMGPEKAAADASGVTLLQSKLAEAVGSGPRGKEAATAMRVRMKPQTSSLELGTGTEDGGASLDSRVLRLCDVWENPAEVESVNHEMVFTTEGKLKRISSITLFDNGGMETDALKAAMNRKRSRQYLNLVSTAEKAWVQMIMMHPSSIWRWFWEIAGCTLLLWDLWFVPFQTFRPGETTATVLLEWAALFYWSSDIIASFGVGFHRPDGVLEMRPKVIAGQYLRTWFLYDFYCVLSDWLLVLVLTGTVAGVFMALRFARLMRVFKLHKRMRNTTRRIQSNQLMIVLNMMKNVIVVMVLNHFIACGWYLVGEGYKISENSWVAQMENRSLSYKYMTCMHWAITQLGVGAVEIAPTNSGERAYAVFAGVCALIISSVLISSVTTGMVRLHELKKTQQDQERTLRDYMRTRDISSKLQGCIWNCLHQARKQNARKIGERDVEAVASLPSRIAHLMRTEVYMPNLVCHPFFKGLFAGDGGHQNKAQRDLLNTALQEMRTNREEDICRTGDPAKRMLFFVSGEIIYKSRLNPDNNAVRLGSQDWFCEQALWLKWAHVGRAQAGTPCDIFVLDAAQFQKIFASDCSTRSYALLFLERVKECHPHLTDAFSTRDPEKKAWLKEITMIAFPDAHGSHMRGSLATAPPEELGFRS